MEISSLTIADALCAASYFCVTGRLRHAFDRLCHGPPQGVQYVNHFAVTVPGALTIEKATTMI